MAQVFTADGNAGRTGDSVPGVEQPSPQLDGLDDVGETPKFDSPAAIEDVDFNKPVAEVETAASRFLAALGSDPVDELSPSSSSEEESSSSSSEGGGLVKTHPILESGQHYVNNKSAVLHCVTGNERFRCGRKITSGYTIVKELNGIRCSRCYNV